MMKITNSSFVTIDNMKLSTMLELMVINVIVNGDLKKKTYIDDII